MSKLPEIYGANVFSDSVMRARLPKGTYKALRKTIDEGLPLEPMVAEVVANAMKDWAIEKGATHYTHWFQPMTGFTAEKHDAFISPTNDGTVILEFSGKELIKGEPDASSFPSGGLRATFEARGYTAWDCTSPAFLKENGGSTTLCIPTAFCSYTGEALDKKTPLLKSMEAINRQAVRVLHAIGDTDVKRVITTVGPEQEYFLIPEELYRQRRDLIYTGRTLFGAKPPKGQELDDHYFGAIKENIACFMDELNMELWKLGIAAKTQHNEVAPSQFELAPVFTTTNVATDHNQLTMETLKKVAGHHGLTCLLHEKPFAGINGSGKHNNWSLSTDKGNNLLDPGKTPHENTQFLLFLAAIIEAVDKHADLLRLSAANPGNDHRLGANEAPPAIISIFLGSELTEILEQIEKGEIVTSKGNNKLEINVITMPDLPMDNTDRNRTSPFAFTGNKFEFRMVGSTASIAGPNTILNAIVADSLLDIAVKIEAADDIESEVAAIIKDIMIKHKRIIFNGDNYTDEWVAEAKRRGLPNIKSMVDSVPYIVEEKNIALLEKHGVYSKAELVSRFEILLEAYSLNINIEAMTTIDMAKTLILPAAMTYASELADSINSIKATGTDVSTFAQADTLKAVTENTNALYKAIDKLKEAREEAEELEGYTLGMATAYHDKVFTTMGELRIIADRLELLVDRELWPFPTYGEMLF